MSATKDSIGHTKHLMRDLVRLRELIPPDIQYQLMMSLAKAHFKAYTRSGNATIWKRAFVAIMTLWCSQLVTNGLRLHPSRSKPTWHLLPLHLSCSTLLGSTARQSIFPFNFQRFNVHWDPRLGPRVPECSDNLIESWKVGLRFDRNQYPGPLGVHTFFPSNLLCYIDMGVTFSCPCYHSKHDKWEAYFQQGQHAWDQWDQFKGASGGEKAEALQCAVDALEQALRLKPLTSEERTRTLLFLARAFLEHTKSDTGQQAQLEEARIHLREWSRAGGKPTPTIPHEVRTSIGDAKLGLYRRRETNSNKIYLNEAIRSYHEAMLFATRPQHALLAVKLVEVCLEGEDETYISEGIVALKDFRKTLNHPEYFNDPGVLRVMELHSELYLAKYRQDGDIAQFDAAIDVLEVAASTFQAARNLQSRVSSLVYLATTTVKGIQTSGVKLGGEFVTAKLHRAAEASLEAIRSITTL
ncbi:hypothetical protein FA15DRAFT_755282 [Coprinopsis marcescibilis]|uniref:Uncharacterized protein n=1 Tax=Coprinopsis marcescibilis TaxID=230819 RepID=A0A5C3L054_COPMA|nr:hypothetical protein FA15DRAFT_755282 [Coprinopsis marcescibilis]